MSAVHPGRPGSDEHSPYFSLYIDRVPAGDLLAQLQRQLNETTALLAPLSVDQVNYRPKPADWNILEVLGHITDGERVFTYRALRIARNDSTPLPSFDQDHYVANANFSGRSLADLLDEYATVRRATLSFYRSLSPEAWLRQGTASDNPISVRALAYIIAGHELHHIADFRERYRI